MQIARNYMEDLNAKIGKGIDDEIVDKLELGTRNERGEKVSNVVRRMTLY